MATFPYKAQINPSVIAQEVLLGETLLMDVKSMNYFGLDEFGSRIWRALAECEDVDVIYRRLIESSDISGDSFTRQFLGVLRGLEVSKIITLEEVDNPDKNF